MVECSPGACRGKKFPMSPHILIYQFPLCGLVSGAHRASGFVLYFAFLFLISCVSVDIIRNGHEHVINSMSGYLTNTYGKLFVIAFALPVIFHMVNGIRFMITDFGAFELLDRKNMILMPIVTVCIAIFLSAIFGFMVWRW